MSWKLLSSISLLLIGAAFAESCGSSNNDCLPAGNYTFTWTKSAGDDMACPDIPSSTTMIGSGSSMANCPEGCNCTQPPANACSGTFSQSCMDASKGNFSCSIGASGSTASGNCSITLPSLMNACNYNIALAKQ